MTFEEIRDMLRSEPNQKKSIPKVKRHHEKVVEVFPNERILEHPQDGIFFANDVMNKDYYYQKLAQRLGYSRVYNFSGCELLFTSEPKSPRLRSGRKRSGQKEEPVQHQR